MQDNQTPDRPSDTEAAHSQDGGAVRDPRQQTGEKRNEGADRNGGNLDHPGTHDRREDYGDTAANQGTDAGTAGARLAEELPDAAGSEPADGVGQRTPPIAP